jgi:hypothetical protein
MEQGSDSQITVTTENATSITKYGEKAVTVDNDYIQSEANARAIAEHMVGYYSEPHIRLENVTILGDPRVEPGDRVGLTDASISTGLNSDWWITGIDYSVSPAFSQELTVVEADFGNYFILDDPVNGLLDMGNKLAP